MTTDSSDAAMWDETPPFSCEVERLDDDDIALVRAAGELDIHTCPEFQKALAAAQEREAAQLVIDLTQVTFMDSTALGVLVVLQRRLKRPLDVVVTRPHLRRVLFITGLNTVFVLHKSLDEARRAT